MFDYTLYVLYEDTRIWAETIIKAENTDDASKQAHFIVAELRKQTNVRTWFLEAKVQFK